MSTNCLRWGIISTGRISNDFVCALKILPPTNHKTVAVAARKIEDARIFARKHDIHNYYGDYSMIAADKDVDIAYIGTINSKHYEVAMTMIGAGKHVLCEKPLSMNKKQSESMIKYARRKGVFLMEAIWSRCFPGYKKLREFIRSGLIGDVLYVNVTVGFDRRRETRARNKSQGGGGVLSSGIYPLQFAQFVYEHAEPISFIASGTLTKEGVDDSTSYIIQYGGRKQATASISTFANFPNEALVVGTTGTLSIPQFWAPSKIYLDGKLIFHEELPTSNHTFNYGQIWAGLCFEAEECRIAIHQGSLESTSVAHAESLQLAEIMDKWRKIIGVEYAEDN